VKNSSQQKQKQQTEKGEEKTKTKKLLILRKEPKEPFRDPAPAGVEAKTKLEKPNLKH